MDNYFVWMDLETTGLDPQHDVIIEAAMVITDADLRVCRSHRVLMPIPKWFDQSRIDSFVREMHTASGLWEALEDQMYRTQGKASYTNYHPTMLEGDLQLFKFLEDFKSTHAVGKLYPAGSSVHFDMSFIKHYMPCTAGVFDHRYYDISALKVHLEAMNGEYPELTEEETHRPIHRAMPDAMNSLEYARNLRGRFSDQFVRGPFAKGNLVH